MAPSSNEPFVWKGEELATIGKLTDAIARLASREEAQEFIAAYRAHTPHADSNAGYVTGYLAPDEGQRLREWMGAAHPIFGMTSPTPEAAFEGGKRWALGEFT
jgi:hypothetical protein